MKQSILFILVLLCVYSCDYPKHYFDTPPICDSTKTQMEFGSDGYSIQELYAILRVSKPENFRYFFKSFHEIDNRTFMLVNFRNSANCLDVLLTIDKLGKLTGMKKTNGKSYPNELFDLEWDIETRDGMLEIVYVDMHDIID